MKTTGRFDYLKTVAREEFFLVNLIIIVCSVLAIVCGLHLMIYETNNLAYSVIFLCASLVMGMNAIKGYKRKNGYGRVFAVMTFAMLGVAAAFTYALIYGI